MGVCALHLSLRPPDQEASSLLRAPGGQTAEGAPIGTSLWERSYRSLKHRPNTSSLEMRSPQFPRAEALATWVGRYEPSGRFWIDEHNRQEPSGNCSRLPGTLALSDTAHPMKRPPSCPLYTAPSGGPGM